MIDTREVGPLTGAGSANDTARRWDVHGTDLGHMFRHRGKLYMVFGDTFGAGGFGGRHWRSNVMARIADAEPRHGLAFEAMIAGPDGAAKELIPSLKRDGVEKTVIPTQGVSVAGRMYLHYMSVRRWGDHGKWQVGHSGMAYSDDGGQNWAVPTAAVWPAATGFEQLAFARREGWLYGFGIPQGRFGGVRLRRVALDAVLRPRAYEYWDGAGWSAEPAAAVEIVPAPVGELSVAWSEAHRRWLMLYLDSEKAAVMLRTAPGLAGPWGAPQTVATAERFPGLYAPYIVPGAEIDGDLYYTLSRWGPYNVFLMHTTLRRAEPSTASTAQPPRPAAPSEG